MEFHDVVRRRRMVRSFEDRPIPAATLDRILDNALHAPSAGFSQGFAFVVLEGDDQTAAFWDLVRPDWRTKERTASIYAAPVVIIPLSHPQAYLDRYSMPDKAAFGLGTADAWPAPYWDIDTGMASLLILLSAVDAGLGAVFIGIFTGERELLDHLGVPAGYRPIGAIALGYRHPADASRPSLRTGRRPREESIHRGRW